MYELIIRIIRTMKFYELDKVFYERDEFDG